MHAKFFYSVWRGKKIPDTTIYVCDFFIWDLSQCYHLLLKTWENVTTAPSLLVIEMSVVTSTMIPQELYFLYQTVVRML